MLRLLADENFNRRIVRAVLDSDPDVDFLTVEDGGLRGRSDADVLAWAASQHCVVVSHDYATMPDEAWARVAARLPMPGLILVPGRAGIGAAARQLREFAHTDPHELDSNVVFLRL